MAFIFSSGQELIDHIKALADNRRRAAAETTKTKAQVLNAAGYSYEEVVFILENTFIGKDKALADIKDMKMPGTPTAPPMTPERLATAIREYVNHAPDCDGVTRVKVNHSNVDFQATFGDTTYQIVINPKWVKGSG